MKKRVLLAAVVLISLFVFVCTAYAKGGKEGEASLSGSVKIAGSSTVYPVSVAIAEEFNRMYPKVEIPVQSTGTGGGFKNFFIPFFGLISRSPSAQISEIINPYTASVRHIPKNSA